MYKKSHIHFVGINGIGMSGIAKILHAQGHIISGCDLALEMNNIQELIAARCNISSSHNATLCNDASIDTFVYSSDVSYDSPELSAARNRGIKTVQRAVILAEIMRPKFSIGVAGSHGKTTTSSMISHILTQAQTDPTVIVGGVMNNSYSNSRYGQGKYTVAETDESDKSLLLLPVCLAVLTNIDFEHVNVYKNLSEVSDVFTTYLNKIPFYGKAVVCLDDKNIQTILPNLICNIITYGTANQANIQAINIQFTTDNASFDIIDNKNNVHMGHIKLPMPSIYNVLNATAAIATCLEIELSFETIKQALESFLGVDRRFTLKGIMPEKNISIYDDYGHHPTEIHHSLITARRKCKNNLIVVFQPQRYSRTFHLWNEFIQTFKNSDITHLILTDIYEASEKPIENITGEQLALEIQKNAPHIQIDYIPYENDLREIKNKVLLIALPHDLILLLGAGKVNKLAEKLLL